MSAWAALELCDNKYIFKFVYWRMRNTAINAVVYFSYLKNKDESKKFIGKIYSDYIKIVTNNDVFYLSKTGSLLIYSKHTDKITVKKDIVISVPLLIYKLKFKVCDCGVGLDSLYQSELFK